MFSLPKKNGFPGFNNMKQQKQRWNSARLEKLEFLPRPSSSLWAAQEHVSTNDVSHKPRGVFRQHVWEIGIRTFWQPIRNGTSLTPWSIQNVKISIKSTLIFSIYSYCRTLYTLLRCALSVDLSFWVVYPSLPSGPASGDEKLSRSNLHPTGVLQWTLESQVPNQASTNQIHSFALRGFEKIPGSYIGHSITNPKNNALLYRKIYQKYHRFALLDPSHMGNSMTPVKV